YLVLNNKGCDYLNFLISKQNEKNDTAYKKIGWESKNDFSHLVHLENIIHSTSNKSGIFLKPSYINMSYTDEGTETAIVHDSKKIMDFIFENYAFINHDNKNNDKFTGYVTNNKASTIGKIILDV